MTDRLKAVLSHVFRLLSGNDLRDETDKNLLDRALGRVRVNRHNQQIQHFSQFDEENSKQFQDEVRKFLKTNKNET